MAQMIDDWEIAHGEIHPKFAISDERNQEIRDSFSVLREPQTTIMTTKSYESFIT
jgi:hypothetical protein